MYTEGYCWRREGGQHMTCIPYPISGAGMGGEIDTDVGFSHILYPISGAGREDR